MFEFVLGFRGKHGVYSRRRAKSLALILSLPLESAFFPRVDVARQNRQDEQKHLNESEKLQIAVNNGPGKKEDGFDIEEQNSIATR
jgi:hypothetical protein